MVAVLVSVAFLVLVVAVIFYMGVFFTKIFLTARKTPDGDSVMNRLLGRGPGDEEFEPTWPARFSGWRHRRSGTGPGD